MTTVAADTTKPHERIRIETGAERVRAYLGGEVVADTARPVLVWCDGAVKACATH
jgi:uncharacterized protein (DUF427 family)